MVYPLNFHTRTNDENEQTNLILEEPNLTNVTNDPSQPFRKEEIDTVIKYLKCGKAEGLDSIINDMMKYSPPAILNL